MARDFDGATNRIDFANSFDWSAQPLTIAANIWIDDLVPAANQYIVAIHASGNAGVAMLFQRGVGESGSINFLVVASTTNLSRTSGLGILATGQWYHAAVTWDGTLTDTGTIIYIDGSVVGSYINSVSGVGTIVPPTGSISLGGRIFDDNRNFDGRIANLGMWSRVLSAAEIASLAKIGSPLLVAPDALRRCIPLIRGVNDLCDSGGTLDGSSVIEHPRTIMPSSPMTGHSTAAAAPTGRIFKLAGYGGGLVGPPKGLVAKPKRNHVIVPPPIERPIHVPR